MFSKKDLTNIEGLMMLYAVKIRASKRQAARDLNVSLDTLDKYIRMLEAEVGVKLLISNGRGCYLTHQGEEVISNIEQLNKCIQNIYEIKMMESGEKGEVKVAYDLNTRINYHTQILKYLFRKHPDIELCIDNISCIPDMNRAEYDIYLSYQLPKGEDLVIIASKKVPFKFFATQKYLDENHNPTSIEDLISNHYLILRKDVWNIVSQAGGQQQKSRKGVVLTNSAFVVNDIALNGYGIGIMPYYFNKFYKDLICLNELDCHTENTLYLISHRNRKDIPKVRIVLDLYKEMIQNL